MSEAINIPKSLLEKLYLKQKLSAGEIAKKFSCHPTTIYDKMQRYKIKVRLLSEAQRKFVISKEDLRNLYEKNQLSTGQIGKLYNYSHATVLNRMKEYKIKRRSQLGLRKPLKISKSLLKNLYIQQKLSESQIAKKLNCGRTAINKRIHLYGIKPRSLSETSLKYPKYNFSRNLTEKAYLIGFRLGDLNVRRVRLLIRIACSTTIPEQVQLIKALFSKYGYVYTKKSRILNNKQVIDIQCLLNESFNFLLPKNDKIEKWILLSNKFFFAFLAGYIDAEGYIFVRFYKHCNAPIAGLEIQSYDKNILHQIWKKLKSLKIRCPKPFISKPKGYTSKKGTTSKQDSWRLSVNRKNDLFSLLTYIKPYIKHKKKKQALQKAENNLISRL